MAAKHLKKIIILFGMPGSGKGTLAFRAANELGWRQLSTGELCRKHISEQTEIGKSIDFAIKSGKLVSDSIISEMVFDWLIKDVGPAEAVIFDGFPRTVEQSQVLSNFLQHETELVDVQLKIIRLVAPKVVVRDRMLSRVICSNKGCQAGYSLDPESGLVAKFDNVCDRCGASLIRRSDDTPEVVISRLETYLINEGQLLDSFRRLGYSITDLDGSRSSEAVFNEFKQVLQL